VHDRFAQDFSAIVRDNDLAVVMAYAHMVRTRTRRVALDSLAHTGARASGPRPFARDDAPPPVMTSLQAYDWNAKRWEFR
jgi:hypothetical protein